MCGIAGFWQKPAAIEQPQEILHQMAASLAHRGPDDSGTFFDAREGVGFAFSRLAIVDLSQEGHQPMHSASGRYVIVFNGEVYNHEQIREKLGPLLWRGYSDTEVMLEAIERWGLEPALRMFIGMFAFALWDRATNNLFLCRDRLGIKPLYFGWIGSTFVFASELKAIAQFPGFEAEIDRDALAMFMRHNCIPAPHCIYRGLRKMDPGCVMQIGSPAASPRTSRFWNARDVATDGSRIGTDASENTAIQSLHEKLSAAVSARMVADVPVGAFLSGGVDSSTVVALMQALSSRPIKTFTVGLQESDYDESVTAAEVAKCLGTDHTELLLTANEVLDVVPSLARIYDEPFADSSQIPTYLVSRLARKSVTVSLSGDGGDELFGGYTRHIFAPQIWNVSSRIPGPMRKAVATSLHSARQWLDSSKRLTPAIRRRLRISALGDKTEKLADVLASADADDLYYGLLSRWDNPEDLVPYSHEPDTIRQSITNLSRALSFQERMMLADLQHYLPDDILTKLDRASMAASLEARVPLLDHRVVELAWQLPTRFKIRNGTGKWILREVLAKFLPRKLIDRPKMGFAIPLDRWLRGPLRDWAEDLLSPVKLDASGYLNGDLVRQKWKEHQQGVRNWSDALWSILIFQDWFGTRPTVTSVQASAAPAHTSF
jgi:asparagine synthase (glutamine-hydrolysing)